MQDDEATSFVSFPNFEKVVLNILKTGEYKPDTDDTLLAAFRVLIIISSFCEHRRT
jgi:hypothetical protein